MPKSVKPLKPTILDEPGLPGSVEWERDLLVAPWIKFPKSRLWDDLLTLAEPKKIAAGDFLARPGDPAHGIYLLKQGEVKIIAKTPGGLYRTFCSMGDESVIGEISMFSGKPYLQYIQAVSDCRLYFFPEKVILENVIPSYPAVTAWLFRNLATKADVTSSMIEETTFYSINVRLARFIYLYALDHGERKGDGIWLRISQQELAERLGAHRVTVTKAINQLKHEKFLKTRPSRVIIEDMKALREMLFKTL